MYNLERQCIERAQTGQQKEESWGLVHLLKGMLGMG